LGSGDKPSFSLAAADGKPALFVDGATGNVGIGIDSLAAKLHINHANQSPSGGALILGPTDQSNLRLGYNQGYSWIQSHGSKPLSINSIGNNVGIGTDSPGNKLTIQGNLNESKDPGSGITYGGLVALKGNAPQIDFIDNDTNHGDWAIHVNDGRMYFIREPWEHEDLVLDGKGNIGIGSSGPQAKLNIREITGTPATALKGTLLLDHEDAGGASSIVFSSRVNRGSDFAFIEYRDRNEALQLDPNVPYREEASLLTIGVHNDAEDHIALMPSGNVGIGTTTPGFKLDVNGSVRLGGFTTDENEEWPNVVWCRDGVKNWDEGLIKHGKERGFFGRAGFGVHLHESRSFELFSTGLMALLGVEGGTGNTSIRGQTTILTGSNPIRFSSAWSRFPDDKTNGAEICNDTDNYKTLMLVGNKSNGGKRRVSVWDELEVNGNLKVTGKVDSQNARIQATAVNPINIDTDTWTDMPQMIVTANIDGPVLVLFKAGGVQAYPGNNARAYFRLLIDGNEKALSTQEFHNGGWELRDASLLWLESSLAVGNHVFKVQWRRGESGRVNACWYGDLRSLIVVNL
jgi:hypothetical protein